MFIQKIKDTPKDVQISILNDFLQKHPKDGVGAYRYLSHLYSLKHDFLKAEEVLLNGIKNNPDNLWLQLYLGDFYFYTLGDKNKGEYVYRSILDKFDKEEKSTMSPYRYVLKRLTTIAYEKKDFEFALALFEKFFRIEPSDFYATDFIKYAEILLHFGQVEKAHEVIKIGIKTHPKNIRLVEFAREHFGLKVEKRKEDINNKDFISIPVKTSLIKEDEDITPIVEKYVLPLLKEGDILTIASTVAGISEGRIYSPDSIKVSPFAKTFSKFINQKSIPFGGAAPLANPYSMQVLIFEYGLLKVVFGLIMGVIGKFLGINGWFYKFTGQQSSILDDPPASIPPYDYYVILGPKDPIKFALRIKEKIGFDVAIVDANDLSAAWVKEQPVVLKKIK
ncbi:MAG: coenzyme F420-0:L-glutamate ligase [Caldisericaceae bacterium]